ncbi:hypothetical protein BASA50_005908 [Batrachochytrium salamandrivorans]|uniref:FAR1 domain-containing protein n=1 Tax=Batrachochytrium salamandrivorans TaxID=1357716 RepID=A0ABQ8FBL3_9FUNG|nr:hypothetical protein BASA61_009417 [Batrachochytrium salamandrivorans]KAH6595390.1 hypothetical protein BASA50_005908 [Batrachochytrium salamandrivorans]
MSNDHRPVGYILSSPNCKSQTHHLGIKDTLHESSQYHTEDASAFGHDTRGVTITALSCPFHHKNSLEPPCSQLRCTLHADRPMLIATAKQWATSQKCTVVIRRSDHRKVVFGCGRGGVYRDRRLPETSQKPIKRRPGRTSQRLGCPYKLVGRSMPDGSWVLSYPCTEHNHPPCGTMGQSVLARPITPEIKGYITDLVSKGVKPRMILLALRDDFGVDTEFIKPRNIYNVIAAMRRAA